MHGSATKKGFGCIKLAPCMVAVGDSCLTPAAERCICRAGHLSPGNLHDGGGVTDPAIFC